MNGWMNHWEDRWMDGWMANNWEKEDSESGIVNHRLKPGPKLAPSVVRRSDQFLEA